MLEEEIDIAVDEIEPALVGLAAQPGRDDDDLAGGDVLMPPAVMRWSAARLAPCSRSRAWPWAMSLLASMRQMSLTTPPHCKRVRRRAADQAAAADDADFHAVSASVQSFDTSRTSICSKSRRLCESQGRFCREGNCGDLEIHRSKTPMRLFETSFELLSGPHRTPWTRSRMHVQMSVHLAGMAIDVPDNAVRQPRHEPALIVTSGRNARR